jgi:hypothetical protein
MSQPRHEVWPIGGSFGAGGNQRRDHAPALGDLNLLARRKRSSTSENLKRKWRTLACFM